MLTIFALTVAVLIAGHVISTRREATRLRQFKLQCRLEMMAACRMGPHAESNRQVMIRAGKCPVMCK